MNRDKIGTQTCYVHQCTNKGMLMYHSITYMYMYICKVLLHVHAIIACLLLHAAPVVALSSLHPSAYFINGVLFRYTCTCIYVQWEF